ncbi:uncharacterized protein MYCFIDRAFT_180600 [Pseudocercospora fijiensis CIRAD86]|uniref:NACHT domain-containing protein n=1 Tax=Pseudocercospora fijiensis (strain CIRAD86) TaxID=383855 RepID=M2ZCV4_PSEFD|nr:uncharacterized protein MYCFIDRAFT_180600 [Pseudocercospora fijiensis CIRAD86]EME76949.1 hypothetical protein MYCFIDRAFT_180600 [Pseudocercospora fijiensis CIRAD86]
MSTVLLLSALCSRCIAKLGNTLRIKNGSPRGPPVAPESVQEILEALFVVDPQKDLLKAQSRARKGRAHGTCEWILERPEYVAWRDQANPQLLMVVGEPGIGKTAMATFLVERLTSETAADDSTFAFFFCNHAEPQRRTAVSILKGLLHQILTRRPLLIEHAHRVLELHGDSGLDDMETLWFLFVRVVQDPRVGQLTLLLDSLDNCEVALRKILVRKLEELLRSSPAVERHHWRLIILTRPHAWDLGTCRRIISGWTELEWMAVISITPAVITKDLGKLIDEEVDMVAGTKLWSEDTCRDVKAQLQSNNGGTFLWISLALKCVANVKEDFVVRRLKRYSCSLRDLYVRVLRRIETEDIELAECTLHYVLGASRPLTLTELAIALAYRPGHFRPGQHLPSDALIDELQASALGSCELLLRVHGKGQHATVEFIHQSVADFLVEHNMPLGLRRFRTSISKAAERLSMACAAYLSAAEMRSLSCDVRRIIKLARNRTVYIPQNHRESIIDRPSSETGASAFSPASSDVWSTKSYLPLTTKQMALLQYATSTWATAGPLKQMCALPIHAMELIRLHSRQQDLIFEAAKIAISEGYDLIFRHLIKILLRTLSLDDGLHLFQAAIQYDECGVEPAVGSKERVFWTQELPDAEAIYRELKRRWSSLVHGAASIGLVDVVKYCIQHDEDVVLRDVDGLTALHMAAKSGHLKVVKVLAQSKVSKPALYVADRHGQLPLHLAVSAIDYKVVKALVKADARKTTLCVQDLQGETPLHRAARLAQPELARVLLDADIEKTTLVTEDLEGRLPLHNAAFAGCIEVTKILFEMDEGCTTLISRDLHAKTALDLAIEQSERKKVNGMIHGHGIVVEYLRTQIRILSGAQVGDEDASKGRARTIAIRSPSM